MGPAGRSDAANPSQGRARIEVDPPAESGRVQECALVAAGGGDPLGRVALVGQPTLQRAAAEMLLTTRIAQPSEVSEPAHKWFVQRACRCGSVDTPDAVERNVRGHAVGRNDTRWRRCSRRRARQVRARLLTSMAHSRTRRLLASGKRSSSHSRGPQGCLRWR